ncbi:hypothetical protein CRG98_023332 [Punica granatum]|uniref:peptidylprolyl isomerase n=1 Tax=Punica granatum TaxID=22663 RepID=A0A2I0JK21_PUNGR|nr:hypothetical protein CRG98_023332 [Punica granatum]
MTHLRVIYILIVMMSATMSSLRVESKQQKKNKQNGPVENPQQGQIVPRNSASVPVLESEDEDGFPISKNASEKKSEEAAEQVDNDTNEKVLKKKKRNVKTIEQDDQSDSENQAEKKKKNKKSQDSGDQQSITKGEKEEKPSQVRTFPNGMVVEELAMGELQKNGEIFDSNVGRAPSKFHLSIGQVIKGWDVGFNVTGPNSWLVFDVELVDVQ